MYFGYILHQTLKSLCLPLLLPLTISPSVCVYVFVCVNVGIHVTAHMWRSEDNLGYWFFLPALFHA